MLNFISKSFIFRIAMEYENTYVVCTILIYDILMVLIIAHQIIRSTTCTFSDIERIAVWFAVHVCVKLLHSLLLVSSRLTYIDKREITLHHYATHLQYS